MWSQPRNKDEFYNQVDSILEQTAKHAMYLLIGDFNARVGREVNAYPGVIGPHSMDGKTDNGQ